MHVGDEERAHRELHFRLLRHNVLSDITKSISKFHQEGGLKSLPSEQENVRQGYSIEVSIRVQKLSFVAKDRTEAKRDNIEPSSDPFEKEIRMDIYRNVTIMALGATRWSGVHYQVFASGSFWRTCSVCRLNLMNLFS